MSVDPAHLVNDEREYALTLVQADRFKQAERELVNDGWEMHVAGKVDQDACFDAATYRNYFIYRREQPWRVAVRQCANDVARLYLWLRGKVKQ